MSEEHSGEHQKSSSLLAYWLFGTVMIVFAAITAYILLIGRMAGPVTTWDAVKAGFPIWGITALAAVLIYAGYYAFTRRKS
jgi:uncharacterized Tic20 family protein